jgi:hypothetical protein
MIAHSSHHRPTNNCYFLLDHGIPEKTRCSDQSSCRQATQVRCLWSVRPQPSKVSGRSRCNSPSGTCHPGRRSKWCYQSRFPPSLVLTAVQNASFIDWEKVNYVVFYLETTGSSRRLDEILRWQLWYWTIPRGPNRGYSFFAICETNDPHTTIHHRAKVNKLNMEVDSSGLHWWFWDFYSKQEENVSALATFVPRRRPVSLLSHSLLYFVCWCQLEEIFQGEGGKVILYTFHHQIGKAVSVWFGSRVCTSATKCFRCITV